MPRKNQPGCPRGCGGTINCCQLKCQPCTLPQKDLLLTWTNPLTGNGSTTLVYNGAGIWTSACTNGLIYQLSCSGGQIDFQVIYFTTGSCPGGTQQYCSNLRTSPYGLTLSAYSCSPLSLTFTSQSAGCPVITGSGYTKFIVTDPNPAANPPGLMCQTVCLGVSGVPVAIENASGTVLASCTTTGSVGCCYMTWPGSPGSYTVVVDGISYPNQKLSCGGTWGFCDLCPGGLPSTITATLVCSTGTYVGIGGQLARSITFWVIPAAAIRRNHWGTFTGKSPAFLAS